MPQHLIATSADATREHNIVLNELFSIASNAASMEALLNESLQALINISWLALLPKAGIFLVEIDEKGQEFLSLKVEINLAEQIKEKCSKVQFGQCLCGSVANTKKALHSSCVDHTHTITYTGMQPHGHYNIPIVMKDTILGVMVFYLPHGTDENRSHLDFLNQAAGVIALAISLRKSRNSKNKIRH